MKFRRYFILSMITVLCISLSVTAFTVFGKNSMADNERKTTMKTSSPMDKAPEIITVSEGEGVKPADKYEILLDGDDWLLTDKGMTSWDKAYKVSVPSSISGALYEAGIIKDPVFGHNDEKAKILGERDWYYKKIFTYNGSGKSVRLCFEGVADRMEVYLNGVKVGEHQGMFGGPYIDVTSNIKKGENTLEVHLLRVLNYTQTVVFNCSYAWHYADLPPIGIWNSVSVKDMEDVELDHPFITTVSAETGTMDMSIDLKDLTQKSVIKGTLYCTLKPKNFTGKAYNFTYNVKADKAGDTNVRVRFDLPEFKLWWPNGLGEQNLYTLETTFVSESGFSTTETSTFAVRSLEMISTARKEGVSFYNRTAVINGKTVFLKGANWCTIDATMHFTREDYDRILCRAYDQGLNAFRAWGGGMVECDAFYDLCDEYGIMVYQEWPCCWDSQKTQPAEVLYETVILNTKRIRNHPSLMVYGGGNEGDCPSNDKVMNRMGTLTYQNDGTRDFWRQDGGVGANGIQHDHIHWGGQDPEYYASNYYNVDRNFHEYGLDAMMNMESIVKIATVEEMTEWPLGKANPVRYHTATFDGAKGWNTTPYGYDIDTYIHYASQFVEVNSLSDLVLGSQIAQTMADYLAVQNSRINFPTQSMVFYYKFNDVYPSGTWAVVDWFGAPKMAYWFIKDAFSPLLATGKFDRYDTYNKGDKSLTVPIYIIDEADELAGTNWCVKVRAYSDSFVKIKETAWSGSGSVEYSGYLGDYTLTAEQTDSAPLFIVIDTEVEGTVKARSYIFMNATQNPGRLTSVPATTLEYEISGNTVTVRNTGSYPAVCVQFDCSGVSDTFRPDDNWFWMEPGETKTVKCNSTEGIKGLKGFNIVNASDTGAPAKVQSISAVSESFDSITLNWNGSSDKYGVKLFWIYVNGQPHCWVEGNEKKAVITGLKENTEYEITVYAVDTGMNFSEASDLLKVRTMPDLVAPVAQKAEIIDTNTIEVIFSRDLLPESVANTEYYMLSGGASVTSAKPGSDARKVILTVSGFDISRSSDYTLTVFGVQDTSVSHNHAERSKIFLNSGISGYWSFDAGEGVLLKDESCSSDEPGYIGNAEWYKTGKIGSAINLKGGDVVLRKGSTSPSSCTFAFWMKLNSLTDDYHILFCKGPKTPGHMEFFTQNGTLTFYSPDSTQANTSLNMKSYVGEWIHMAFVCENKAATVYINGEKKAKISLGKISEAEMNFYIGSLPGGQFATDAIFDEVYIFDKALDVSAVTDLMNGTYFRDVCMDSGCYKIKPGETQSVNVQFRGVDSSAYSFTWTSADESVATVDTNGLITAVSEGETVITMTSSDGSVLEKAIVMVGDFTYIPQEYSVGSSGSTNIVLIAAICGGVVLLAAAVLVIAIVKSKKK